MVELDEVVRQNQLDCLPFVKSGKAESDLIDRHPTLVSGLEKDKSIKIDQAYLQTKIREKETRVSGAKASGGLLENFATPHISPRISAKGRRRSDAKSPMLRAQGSAHDLMFDMEDLEEKRSRAAIPKRQHSNDPTLGLTDLELPETARPESRDAISANNSLDVSGSRPFEASASTSKLPWAQTAVETSKLDMKQIMAQASHPQTSNISNAIKQSQPSKATPTKLSQRERKKLQQEQLALASSPIPDPLPR